MDLDDFRSILETAGVDVWTFIDTAITVAALDYGNDLKHRRDGIVERLYVVTSAPASCLNCEPNHVRSNNGHGISAPIRRQSSPPAEKRRASPATPQSLGKDEEEDDEIDPYGGLFDDEQKKILEIKEQLEEPNQSEESLVDLLQNLADMDITFQALKETDIGRHVNRLRKNSSNDVRRLVKLLVRKWKDIVDEWVKLNPPGEHASLMADGDSPPQRNPQNGHNQIPDFAYSPNPHNGSSGSDRNDSEAEPKQKSIPRKEAPPKPLPSVPTPASAPQNVRMREQRESNFDAERLASARRRLQENYKEAENAKRQRTIQVMDIHDLPKPKSKNAFFPKNKGGGGSQGRHW
ncbi:putative mediator of RNA polymerase II transcription subunit 26c [Senna tora]|uniref:Putative mediator of RNA polymerase II transcription subunit 26c n=1 Tax=Senna tora TaxID=362788 RepID=A0A834WX22_9FABA|nr:putative mediator of RNA polymerase II transcription subunit 26c [Senna tora]